MVFDHMLAAAGDENELPDTRLARLFDGILDDGLVDHRQHFFGNGLGGGQKAGAHPRDRKYGFTNALWCGHLKTDDSSTTTPTPHCSSL